MTPKLVRRVAVAAVSVAVTAGGFLAAGGTASATPLRSSEQSVLTHVIDSHRELPRTETAHIGGHHHHGRGHGTRDRDGRPDKIRPSAHDTDRGLIDEARRTWVLDQLQWIRDHNLYYTLQG
ncbi:hypothetical protein ACQPXS_45570 [Streptomyces sp. CA-142005]|uniref:hypothetical protein n=1 Tax=Streptomyces sp. CA-142005 TaxID=3240052 RepID=UPI003D9018DA